MYAPLEEDGRWQRYECATSDMDALRPAAPAAAHDDDGRRMSRAPGVAGDGPVPRRPVSMLLAFFNVRLGAWIPNPRYAETLANRTSGCRDPGWATCSRSSSASTTPATSTLYVTDGGHWRTPHWSSCCARVTTRRSCCVDADAGPGNLAKSISKAIDLAQLECAANIAINLDVLCARTAIPSPGRDYSQRSVDCSAWYAVATGAGSGSASCGTASRLSPRTCLCSRWPTGRSTRPSRG